MKAAIRSLLESLLPLFRRQRFDEPALDELDLIVEEEDFANSDLPYKQRSYEWLPFKDKDPVCWAPWRVLKVDIYGKTQNCCGFFERMPEFDWPTARDFHRDEGLWNNPLLQHLRTTMGTPSELPFCTLCKEEDKRHPDNAVKKRIASIESGKVFQTIYDRHATFAFRGAVDKFEGNLSTFSVRSSIFPDVRLSPFRKEKVYYRRLIRSRGFWNLGRVLQIGNRSGAIAPFLAESNQSLATVDTSKGRLRNCKDLLTSLGFDDQSFTLPENPSSLPFEAGSFDGIWLEGEWLSLFGRKLILEEVRRLLKVGGIVYVSGAHGLGEMVTAALRAETPESLQSCLEIIRNGPRYDGVQSFLTADYLIGALKKTGLQLDRSRPALSRYRGGVSIEKPIWRNYALLASELKDEESRRRMTSSPVSLNGVVERVSFTATAS